MGGLPFLFNKRSAEKAFCRERLTEKQALAINYRFIVISNGKKQGKPGFGIDKKTDYVKIFVNTSK